MKRPLYAVGQAEPIGFEETSDCQRPTVTVGLLGLEVDLMIHDGKHVTNLRLDEIERRILAIEAQLNA